MIKTVKNKTIFWDYNLKNIDLQNKDVKTWYISRKLRFGDLVGIKKNDLKKCFSKLSVSSSLKELLSNFLYGCD